ncbi:Stress-associated endoplasmic reticulum protein - like 1, partial [Theobroma cacao]
PVNQRPGDFRNKGREGEGERERANRPSWKGEEKNLPEIFVRFLPATVSGYLISPSSLIMTTSRRLADRKVEKFEKNITKRGTVPETTTKKGKDYPVGPLLLGFFIFVVIGSSLFQIIRTATSGGMA